MNIFIGMRLNLATHICEQQWFFFPLKPCFPVVSLVVVPMSFQSIVHTDKKANLIS